MAAFWLVGDLASKEWMFAWLEVPDGAGPGGPFGEPAWLLRGFLRWSAYVNSGAAFGMGGRRPGLVLLAAGLMLPALVWLAYRTREKGAPLWALGATVGGALGNLHDRCRLAGVRDFIELVNPATGEMLWPVFNLADMGIVGGVLVFFVWSVFAPGKKRENGEEPPAGVEDGHRPRKPEAKKAPGQAGEA